MIKAMGNSQKSRYLFQINVVNVFMNIPFLLPSLMEE